MKKTPTLRLTLGLMALLLTAVPAISPLPAESAAAAGEAAAVRQVEDRYGVRVNGVPMTQDPMLTAVNGVAYASVRNVAQALLPDASITWDGQRAIVSKPGVLTLTAAPNASYVVANGRYLYVPDLVRARNGAILVPLHILTKAMDATYQWRTNGSLDLYTGSGGIQSGEEYYGEDALYWLSHIIYAESGNQPLKGKMAVGNVVLNRVNDPRFPDSIYSVIFQRNQFSPAASGSIYRQPNEESILAAKLCLDGGVALDGVLYFNRTGLKSWASRNRTFVATIADHTFYG